MWGSWLWPTSHCIFPLAVYILWFILGYYWFFFAKEILESHFCVPVMCDSRSLFDCIDAFTLAPASPVNSLYIWKPLHRAKSWIQIQSVTLFVCINSDSGEGAILGMINESVRSSLCFALKMKCMHLNESKWSWVRFSFLSELTSPLPFIHLATPTALSSKWKDPPRSFSFRQDKVFRLSRRQCIYDPFTSSSSFSS